MGIIYPIPINCRQRGYEPSSHSHYSAPTNAHAHAGANFNAHGHANPPPYILSSPSS